MSIEKMRNQGIKKSQDGLYILQGVGWDGSVSYDEEKTKEIIAESDGTGNLMYSPLERVFHATMKREGRMITTNTTGSQFKAFMRRETDGNTNEDRILIFYGIENPVRQGMIINYGNRKYILINRETEENNCYYKSYALACNGTINTNSGSVKNIPIYAPDMQRALTYTGNVFTFIEGNIEFLTEENAQSHILKINDTFNEFGRTFKIGNIYYKDGMCHVMGEVTTNENPSLSPEIKYSGISSDGTYTKGTQLQISVELHLGERLTKGTVTYSSSDPEIVSINENGYVTFLQDGAATIYIYWVEQKIGETIRVICNGETISHTLMLSASSNTIKVGGSYKTISAKITDMSGTDITDTITVDNGYSQNDFKWIASIDGKDVTNADFITWLNVSNLYQIKVKFGDNRTYLTHTLVIKCKFVPQNVESTLELEISI